MVPQLLLLKGRTILEGSTSLSLPTMFKMDTQHQILESQNLDGSFFNNFDNTTHVSEILRFMSGVLSHSLDVADGCTKYKNFCKC